MKNFILTLCILPIAAFAQNVGIGTATPNSSAMLEVSSTTKGLLVPRMTKVQKSAIASPATGLLIWQTDGIPGFYYNGGMPESPDWYMIGTADENQWKLTGNADINANEHFLGTTTKQPLRFRINNIWAGSIDSAEGTYIGFNAGKNNVVGNVAFGDNALATNETSGGLTAIGRYALEKNRGGNSNTALGVLTLRENITGSWNTAIGSQSMVNNTTGSENVAIGQFSLYNNKGDNNVAVGIYTLGVNEGFNNVGIGNSALRFNTSGSWNIGIGTSALRNTTTGISNVGIGISALNANDTGSSNVAVGSFALNDNKVDNNTALGARSLSDNTFGSHNTAVGADALGNNTTGDYNSAIGFDAGKGNFTGNYNTYLGYNTSTSSTRINATTVGYSALAECSNCLILGSVDGKNSSNVTVRVGIGTTNPQYRLQVGMAGDGSEARANAWNTFSDERFKTNIVPIENALQKISGLHGYFYNWNVGDDQKRQAGFLAQEVERVLPEIVSTDGEGYKSVDYGKMNALLLQAIKEQQVLIDLLMEKVNVKN